MKNNLILIIFGFLQCINLVYAQEDIFNKQADLWVHSKTEKIHFEVEIADTPRKLSFGLMYRHNLGTYQGLLFLMGKEKIQKFWMLNCYISLDIIFINKNKIIVDVIKKAQPGDKNIRASNAPSLYVLEINGGHFDKNKMQIGDSLSWKLTK